MTRFLIIFALALIPVQGLLYLIYQYYGFQLTFNGAAFRALGGAIAAGYIAWRIDRAMGGGRKTPGADSAGNPLYQRPTAGQIAGMGGKAPETTESPAGDIAAETQRDPAAPISLAERLRQQQAKRD